MLVALKPIHDAVHIKRIVVTTFQAVSGAGQKGINELEQQVRDLFNSREIKCDKFPYRIAFNVLPQIDIFLDNDYTKEEMKMVNETCKILRDDSIRVTATTVRVPTIGGHSESVNVELAEDFTLEEVRRLLSETPGVVVQDDPQNNVYPMPGLLAGTNDTYVGRIRRDDTVDHGLSMWVVADQIRKGAALNAVQIAQLLLPKD